jgi:hypothetical protein
MTQETEMTDLPAPEQWVIERMTESEVAEMIEQHIDFIDKNDRSVHLQPSFVRHYMKRDDGALPTLVAVTTLPIILADGHVLGREDGFDGLRGISFRTQSEVSACVPQLGSVTDDDVATAMRFLTDEWLVDVNASYAGKCTIIAAALTIIERSLLDQRPAFFVTSGRRGGGKTTTLIMLIKGVTGIRPAAAAWSTNEEERRKALLSYFMSGVPYILWDNIARGTRISCPHIERSCTAAYYADRKLGVSEMVATAASTIHLFNGNNIAPSGDLASRSLEIRLEVDRWDPENREFTHPDPIGWTDSMRAVLLRAFYTILLGNPTLKLQRDAEMKTRFKMWWRVVGSAIEHAAQLATDRAEPSAYELGGPPAPCAVDFRKLFLEREAQHEDQASLADALAVLAKWPTQAGFKANDVAELVNDVTTPCDPYARPRRATDLIEPADRVILRDFLYPSMPPGFRASPRSVGCQLRDHIDEPVRSGQQTLTLKAHSDAHGHTLKYYVKVVDDQSAQTAAV